MGTSSDNQAQVAGERSFSQHRAENDRVPPVSSGNVQARVSPPKPVLENQAGSFVESFFGVPDLPAVTTNSTPITHQLKAKRKRAYSQSLRNRPNLTKHRAISERYANSVHASPTPQRPTDQNAVLQLERNSCKDVVANTNNHRMSSNMHEVMPAVDSSMVVETPRSQHVSARKKTDATSGNEEMIFCTVPIQELQTEQEHQAPEEILSPEPHHGPCETDVETHLSNDHIPPALAHEGHISRPEGSNLHVPGTDLMQLAISSCQLEQQKSANALRLAMAREIDLAKLSEENLKLQSQYEICLQENSKQRRELEELSNITQQHRTKSINLQSQMRALLGGQESLQSGAKALKSQIELLQSEKAELSDRLACTQQELEHQQSQLKTWKDSTKEWQEASISISGRMSTRSLFIIRLWHRILTRNFSVENVVKRLQSQVDEKNELLALERDRIKTMELAVNQTVQRQGELNDAITEKQQIVVEKLEEMQIAFKTSKMQDDIQAGWVCL